MKHISVPDKVKISKKRTAKNDDNSLKSISSEDISQSSKTMCCTKDNPAEGRGRKMHLLQMIILPFIPSVALIAQTGLILNNIVLHRQEVREIEAQVGAVKNVESTPNRIKYHHTS